MSRTFIRLQVAVAKFKASGWGGGPPLVVKGEGPGFTLWGANNAPGAGVTNWEVTVYADLPLTNNLVQFFNPMTITWSYRALDDTQYCPVGTSTNQVYVTWQEPGPYANLRHTVVHLGCQNTGGNTADTVFENTWKSFSDGNQPANVTTWDGTNKLYYYRDSFPATNAVTSALDLLSNTNHNGQCGAWMHLMFLSLQANGIPWADSPGTMATYTIPKGSQDDDWFLVKHWSFGPEDTNNPVYPWTLEVGVDASGNPLMTSSTVMTGTVTNGIGLKGQNSTNPAEKIFGNHQVIHYKNSGGQTNLYDPSYGRIYASEDEFFAQCVEGFAKRQSINATSLTLGIKRNN